MSNHNITQRGTQATCLGVMIGRCSPNSQHGGGPDRHPTNVGCSFFRYIKDDVTNHNEQTPKCRTWTREENLLALECYIRCNPSQRGYRKRMIEIWQKRSTFQTTSQRLIRKRGAEISGKKEQATWGKITVQLEEINQTVLAKEERLNRYRQRVKQYRPNWTFQNNERKFYQQLGGSDTKTYKQPDIKNRTILDLKYGNQRNIRKIQNG